MFFFLNYAFFHYLLSEMTMSGKRWALVSGFQFSFIMSFENVNVTIFYSNYIFFLLPNKRKLFFLHLKYSF